MIMSVTNIYVCALVCLAGALFAEADRCACNLPDTHYKELGCKPIYEKPDDCCPKRYDCSEPIKLSEEPGKCWFNGKQYSDGEKIDNSLTEPNCVTGLTCKKDNTRDFIYAHIDCPEFLHGPRLEEGCFRQYKLGGCCATGKPVCPPFSKDLATCKVGDKTVYEGQKFSPDFWTSCVCQKGYEGKNVEPFCRKLTCGTAWRAFELRRGDMPIYIGEGNGCPVGWIAKKEGEYENVGKKLEGTLDDKSCRFGNRVLNLGEKFKVEDKHEHSPEINCECRLPPLMSCAQKPQAESTRK